MYKQEFIIDTDSLIKLTKSDIIKDVCEYFRCSISEEVYNEAVIRGKEGLHQDAFEIEKLLKNKLVKLKKCKKERKIEFRDNLGEGEKSTFILYQRVKNSIIVSDDNTFINFLKKENADFIVPADFITLLKKLNKIDKVKSLSYLENLKPYIKPIVYLNIKKKLEV